MLRNCLRSLKCQRSIRARSSAVQVSLSDWGSDKEQRDHNHDKKIKNWTFFGFMTSFAAISAYHIHDQFILSRDQERSKSRLWKILIPTVHAARGAAPDDAIKITSPSPNKESFLSSSSSSSRLLSSSSRKLSHNFIADAVEIALPAVVKIEALVYHPFDPRVIIGSSGGSGFLISPSLILTNAHVVQDKQSFQVILSDGTTIDHCIIEAIDQNCDLATIRINVDNLSQARSRSQIDKKSQDNDQDKNLPYIRLGDSSLSRPGEFVIALGSPVSLSNTVTCGIISSLKRDLSKYGLDSQIEYIQTDAAINIGNSGGPLIDINGDAIGINTLRMSDGIAFAIPSNVALSFLKSAYQDDDYNQLKRRAHPNTSHRGNAPSRDNKISGEDKRSREITIPIQIVKRKLGIQMLSLNQDMISHLMESHKPLGDQFNHLNKITSGVLVLKVLPGSPAFLAGLRYYDVITEINQIKINKAEDVYNYLATCNDQDELKIKIKRDGIDMIVIVPPDSE